MRCEHCGSKTLSKITLELGDGTEVALSTCHFCEYRTWSGNDGDELSLSRVVAMATANRPR